MMGCYYDSNLCEGELWQCKTCGRWFCEFHWHDTELGYCVECGPCERLRLRVAEMLSGNCSAAEEAR